MKRRTTKGKGDVFEVFCVLYLKAIGYEEAWLLQETPLTIIEHLGLKPKHDVGIDIIAVKNGQYYAVQSKYRTVPKDISRPHCVRWSELSTFYSLCNRTGPWCKHIVMTNCNYVSRKGRKCDSDYTIAKKKLEGTPRNIWLAIVGDTGYSLLNNTPNKEEKIEEKKEVVEKIDTQIEMKTKRAAYFDKLLKKETHS
jgi:hypothetical protein